jgi:hypothetical protein
MAASEELPPRVEALLNELTDVHRDLAADLLRAVTAYTEAELRLTDIDTAAGYGIPSDRVDRLSRLDAIRTLLERDLQRRDA